MRDKIQTIKKSLSAYRRLAMHALKPSVVAYYRTVAQSVNESAFLKHSLGLKMSALGREAVTGGLIGAVSYLLFGMIFSEWGSTALGVAVVIALSVAVAGAASASMPAELHRHRRQLMFLMAPHIDPLVARRDQYSARADKLGKSAARLSSIALFCLLASALVWLGAFSAARIVFSTRLSPTLSDVLNSLAWSQGKDHLFIAGASIAGVCLALASQYRKAQSQLQRHEAECTEKIAQLSMIALTMFGQEQDLIELRSRILVQAFESRSQVEEVRAEAVEPPLTTLAQLAAPLAENISPKP